MDHKIASSPFNNDQPFTTAELRTISYKKLVAKDPAEQAKLLDCGEKDGFFYLDLLEPESEGLWNDYKSVLAVMSEFFEQPVESKLPYAYGSDVQGYAYSH